MCDAGFDFHPIFGMTELARENFAVKGALEHVKKNIGAYAFLLLGAQFVFKIIQIMVFSFVISEVESARLSKRAIG